MENSIPHKTSTSQKLGMSRNRRRNYSLAQQTQNIPAKANLVLNVILIAMVLIILRIWHLSVIQHDQKEEESRRPQRRTVIEPAKRGTIRDRFNIPLAINRIQYNAAVTYSELRQIPSIKWERTVDGKKIKRSKRKEYIAQLAQTLGSELNLDPERLEDLIHSKASFYNHIPFVIKEDISEEEYYRLKMLENEWLGITVQRLPRRYYPQGRVAGDIIGYMGAINKKEYEEIIHEMASLESYLKARELGEDVAMPDGFDEPAKIKRRLKDLQEKAYTINDYVGKAGVEGRFERDLRGFSGRKSYYSDARGNYLRELPGSREPLSGQRILLTISSELQEFTEKLLAQNERVRFTKATILDKAKHAMLSMKQPWIKGGAIVLMDPHTGEILAMASHPRYNPNDFILSGNQEINKVKKSNINKWFETDEHLADIWNQRRPFECELYCNTTERLYDDGVILTWEKYISLVLPEGSPVMKALQRWNKVENAVEIQGQAEKLLALSGQDNIYLVFNEVYKGDGHVALAQKVPVAQKELAAQNLNAHAKEAAQIKRILDRYFHEIPDNYDKVLMADLCRLAVNDHLFNEGLLKSAGKQTLSVYRDMNAAAVFVNEAVKNLAKELFHDHHFKPWRQDNEKAYLKEKRAQEKEQKKYARPYIDYLDAMEAEMFNAFWLEHRWTFLEAFLIGQNKGSLPDHMAPYVRHFTTWHQEIAKGAHQGLEWMPYYLKLQKVVMALPDTNRTPYLASLRSFHDLNRPLLGRYPNIRKSNNRQYEKHLAGAFYPVQGFGYGRSQAYRQAATQGSIFKLVTAYEAMAQKYQAQSDAGVKSSSLNPLEIVDNVFQQGKETYVGYTSDGKPIPRFYKGGRLPRSKANFLGRIDMLRAIETSSNPYFALLTVDVMRNPQDLANAAQLFSYGSRTGIDLPAEITGKVPDDLEHNRTGLYSMAIGQHTLVVTPLQTSVMLSSLANGGKILKPKIVNYMAGSQPQRGEVVGCPPVFKYQDSLAGIGIDFPLFTAANAPDQKNLVCKMPTVVKREIFMPAAIRKTLLEGMYRVVVSSHASSLASLSRIYHEHPEAISDYIDLKEELLGKTSTAESVEAIDLDLHQGRNMYNHVWFGGIAFEKAGGNENAFLFKDKFGKPDVVVVVYLRYGGYGKEAGPIAAQAVAKWREIKKRWK